MKRAPWWWGMFLTLTVALPGHAGLDSKSLARAPVRPTVVFIIAENEYRTEETLPEFARQELEPRGIRCRFIYAPVEDGNPHFTNYGVIREADLVFISVRRRTPPTPMMELLRHHVAAGKPVVGIRTASHAFAATPPDRGHASWPEFDAEVLGGNYGGHYGNKPPAAPATIIRPAPGAAGHPVLTGVTAEEFRVTSHLYMNRQPAPTIVRLLVGQVEGRAEVEPVAWVYTRMKRRVFYTSLGNPDDFKLPAFRRLLLNGTLWALGRPIPPAQAAAGVRW